MRLKVEGWADRVRTGHLSRQDAWTCLQTTIMKQIEYPLLALNLTEDDCKEIEKPLIKIGLPTIGMSTSTLRKMVFGPET